MTDSSFSIVPNTRANSCLTCVTSDWVHSSYVSWIQHWRGESKYKAMKENTAHFLFLIFFVSLCQEWISDRKSQVNSCQIVLSPHPDLWAVQWDSRQFGPLKDYLDLSKHDGITWEKNNYVLINLQGGELRTGVACAAVFVTGHVLSFLSCDFERFCMFAFVQFSPSAFSHFMIWESDAAKTSLMKRGDMKVFPYQREAAWVHCSDRYRMAVGPACVAFNLPQKMDWPACFIK